VSIGKLGPIENVNRDTPLATERNLERTERAQPKQPRNAQLEQAAKMYEHHFLQEMVKAMRSTVSESEITKGGIGDKIYKDQLDDKYVEQWSESGGIGLADMIYDEMMEKVLNRYNGSRGMKPEGPIKLTDRDVSRVVKAPSSIANQTAMRVELKDDPSKTGPTQLKAPLDSKVLTTTRVDGKSTILLEHEGGVRSALIFDGVLSQVKPGDSLKRGTQIGVLSPEIKSFFWNVTTPKESTANTSLDQAKNSGPEDATGKGEIPR
jgi:peptidoglycan hydrolase FlgJ